MKYHTPNWGELFKNELKSKRITQAAFAEMMGLTKNNIYLRLRRKNWSLRLIRQVSHLCNYDFMIELVSDETKELIRNAQAQLNDTSPSPEKVQLSEKEEELQQLSKEHEKLQQKQTKLKSENVLLKEKIAELKDILADVKLTKEKEIHALMDAHKEAGFEAKLKISVLEARLETLKESWKEQSQRANLSKF